MFNPLQPIQPLTGDSHMKADKTSNQSGVRVEPRSSSRKVRIRAPDFFFFVYFSRGPLPQKKFVKGHYWGTQEPYLPSHTGDGVLWRRAVRQKLVGHRLAHPWKGGSLKRPVGKAAAQRASSVCLGSPGKKENLVIDSFFSNQEGKMKQPMEGFTTANQTGKETSPSDRFL